MTRVITANFALGGLTHPQSTIFGTSQNPSTSPWAPVLTDIIRGYQLWTQHADVIIVRAPDSNAPLTAGQQTPWHVRSIIAAEVGGTSAYAHANGYAGAAVGTDAYTTYVSNDAYSYGGMFSSNPITYTHNVAMHEAGHNLMNLPHDTSAPNIMDSTLSSFALLPYQAAQAVSLYGSPTSIVTKHYGNVGFVSNVYYGLLYRGPDAFGFKHYVHSMNSGMSLSTVISQVMSTGEYASVHSGESDYTFVYNLYSRVLNRIGSGPELTYWAGQCATMGRAWVAESIINTNEAKDALTTKYPNGWWNL